MKTETLYGLIGFGVGTVVGAIGSALILNKWYNDKVDKMEELYKKYEQDVDDNYEAFVNAYGRLHRDELSFIGNDDAEVNPVKDDDTEEEKEPELSEEERARQERIKEQCRLALLNHQKNEETWQMWQEKHKREEEEAAAAMTKYQGSRERTHEELQQLFKDAHDRAMIEDEDEDEDDEDEHLGDIYIDPVHELIKDNPPYVMSDSEYYNPDPNIDTAILYWYHNDDTLIDDDDEEHPDPTVLLGECFYESGFIDSADPVIHIFNPALNTAYEVQRVNQAWYDQSNPNRY